MRPPPAVRTPALTQTLVMGRGRSTLLQPMRMRVQARQLLGGQRMSLTAPQIAPRLRRQKRHPKPT